MECGKCRKSIGDCTCPDMDERMKSLRNNPRYVYKMCEKCGRHFERCDCEHPVWVSSNPDMPLPELMNAPTVRDVLESQKKKAEGKLH